MNHRSFARAIALGMIALFLAGCAGHSPDGSKSTPLWGRFEVVLASACEYANPLQETRLEAVFIAPSGRRVKVDGFWDGGRTWRVRFMPDEAGNWRFETACSDTANRGLHGKRGRFVCATATGQHRFAQHGVVRVSANRRYLEHADGTPFLWLADTCWNGALLAKPDEWGQYIRERTRQKFTAVQWTATQWRATPEGDLEKRRAFTGTNQIAVNPTFFQQLDAKADALNRAGLLNIPVLLWAIGSGSDPKVNPGFALPEDQAILLARYMVARWQAHHVVWILPGDGDYRGERAERWKRIGRAVFGQRPHAPTMLHPGGLHWNWNEFKDEPWLDLIGYQSGHGDDEKSLRWVTDGPPATDWKKEPARPFLNLEPPYENHLAYQSRQPHLAYNVRRAMYWSLLNAPTAGVSYGGHGVWGWDDGTTTPVDHPRSGVPLAWQKALLMPGAEQVAHVHDIFTAIEFHKLRPAPELLVHQPGRNNAAAFISAARSEDGKRLVIYTPLPQRFELRPRDLPKPFKLEWFNPRDGKRLPVIGILNGDNLQFTPPGDEDWLLLVSGG